jgi:hypothetical protein
MDRLSCSYHPLSRITHHCHMSHIIVTCHTSLSHVTLPFHMSHFIVSYHHFIAAGRAGSYNMNTLNGTTQQQTRQDQQQSIQQQVPIPGFGTFPGTPATIEQNIMMLDVPRNQNPDLSPRPGSGGVRGSLMSEDQDAAGSEEGEVRPDNHCATVLLSAVDITIAYRVR